MDSLSLEHCIAAQGDAGAPKAPYAAAVYSCLARKGLAYPHPHSVDGCGYDNYICTCRKSSVLAQKQPFYKPSPDTARDVFYVLSLNWARARATQ